MPICNRWFRYVRLFLEGKSENKTLETIKKITAEYYLATQHVGSSVLVCLTQKVRNWIKLEAGLAT